MCGLDPIDSKSRPLTSLNTEMKLWVSKIGKFHQQLSNYQLFTTL